jgi:hypothetical protein
VCAAANIQLGKVVARVGSSEVMHARVDDPTAVMQRALAPHLFQRSAREIGSPVPQIRDFPQQQRQRRQTAHTMARDSDYEEDTDESDDNYDVDPVASYEQDVNAAKKDIKSRRRFGNDDDTDRFLDQYHEIAHKFVPKADGNLLHALIDVVKHNPDDVKSEDVELLVRRIVEKWPDRVKDVNKQGNNPVFVAINNSQHELVNYMLSACQNRECLETALSEKDQTGMTCLHAAFKENIDANTTKILVKTASDAALAEQDNAGKTPMRTSDPRFNILRSNCLGNR